jgi:hypothetical protein
MVHQRFERQLAEILASHGEEEVNIVYPWLDEVITSEEMYKLKVKIKKDYLKTEQEITKDMALLKDTETKASMINPQLMNYINSTNQSMKDINSTKTGKGIAAMTGNVVYRSVTSRSRDIALYLIIAVLAILGIILARNLFKTGKPVQKL